MPESPVRVSGCTCRASKDSTVFNTSHMGLYDKQNCLFTWIEHLLQSLDDRRPECEEIVQGVLAGKLAGKELICPPVAMLGRLDRIYIPAFGTGELHLITAGQAALEWSHDCLDRLGTSCGDAENITLKAMRTGRQDICRMLETHYSMCRDTIPHPAAVTAWLWWDTIILHSIPLPDPLTPTLVGLAENTGVGDWLGSPTKSIAVVDPSGLWRTSIATAVYLSYACGSSGPGHQFVCDVWRQSDWLDMKSCGHEVVKEAAPDCMDITKAMELYLCRDSGMYASARLGDIDKDATASVTLTVAHHDFFDAYSDVWTQEPRNLVLTIGSRVADIAGFGSCIRSILDEVLWASTCTHISPVRRRSARCVLAWHIYMTRYGTLENAWSKTTTDKEEFISRESNGPTWREILKLTPVDMTCCLGIQRQCSEYVMECMNTTQGPAMLGQLPEWTGQLSIIPDIYDHDQCSTDVSADEYFRVVAIEGFARCRRVMQSGLYSFRSEDDWPGLHAIMAADISGGSDLNIRAGIYGWAQTVAMVTEGHIYDRIFDTLVKTMSRRRRQNAIDRMDGMYTSTDS